MKIYVGTCSVYLSGNLRRDLCSGLDALIGNCRLSMFSC